MGRSACCAKVGLRRGPWSTKEDSLLSSFILQNGEGQWRSLPKKAGLLRCGKSCRLRWMNYLRPGIKRGNISEDEEDLIVRLHTLLGNRWSLIAGRLPGRTDNEIKNYWNTHLLKKLSTNCKNKPPPINKNNKKKKLKPAAAAPPEKDKEIGKEEEEIQLTQTVKSKVYFPKPIRVSSLPRTQSYDSLASASTSCSDGAAEVVVSALPPLFEVEDPAMLYLYSDDADMWEKVYAEYMQLL